MEKKLTKEELGILKKGHTELPFSSTLLYNKQKGVYACKFCGNVLFKSKDKYDSGSGWPSFSDADRGKNILKEDRSLGMNRIEVRCKKCNSHLGHLFNDGPAPTHNRFCINGAALNFRKKG